MNDVSLELDQTLQDLSIKDGDTLMLLIRKSPSFRFWRILNNADGAGGDGNRWGVKRLEFYCGEELLETKDRHKAFADSNARHSDHIGTADIYQPFVGELDLTCNNRQHWSSGFGAGSRAGVSFLGYDFTGAVSADRLRIVQYPEGGGTTSVKVQGSDDKESWQTIWTQDLQKKMDWPAIWEDHSMP